MKCDDVRERLPDRLDDLLEPDDVRALDEHVLGCAACGRVRDRVAVVREALYRPWAVDESMSVVPARRSPASRIALVLLRYAAVFAAGVLVAQYLGPTHEAASVPMTAPPALVAPAVIAPASDYPLRIR